MRKHFVSHTGRAGACASLIAAPFRASSHGCRAHCAGRKFSGWDSRVPRHPVRRAAARSAAVESAAAGRALGRRSQGRRVRSRLRAAQGYRPSERLRRHARLAAGQRRLFVSQRVDRRDARQRTASRDGVDFRRRVHRRRRFEPPQRRRGARAQRRRRRHAQLSARSVRVLFAPRARQRIGTQRVRQSGRLGLHRGVEVGADKHRGLRWRPRERDDFRRVGRRGAVGGPGRIASGQWPVPPCDLRERCVDGPQHGADAIAPVGRRSPAPAAARCR